MYKIAKAQNGKHLCKSIYIASRRLHSPLFVNNQCV